MAWYGGGPITTQTGCDSSQCSITVGLVEVAIDDIGRVAPSKIKPVTVTLTVSPPGLSGGCSIALSCEADAGTQGSATVSPSSISGSTTVTVQGGAQSWGQGDNPAPNNLKLKATLGSCVLAEKRFTVCAHPHRAVISSGEDYSGVIPGVGAFVGLKAKMSLQSDSENSTHLDRVWIGEVVARGPTDTPPFTNVPPTTGPGHWALPLPFDDIHAERVDGLQPPPGGEATFYQLYTFSCLRCGLAEETCPNSGFSFVFRVRFKGDPEAGWYHRCKKEGCAVIIGNRSSSAGAGAAQSTERKIKP